MFTKIECGECGGDYSPKWDDLFHCMSCGHSVTTYDLLPNMEEGESLTVREVLGYITEEV